MLFPSFRRHAEDLAGRKRSGRSPSARPRLTRRQLGIEQLEDRTLLSLGFGWSFNVGGPNVDEGFGIATDAQGKVYVTGYFTGPNVNFAPPNSTPYYLSTLPGDNADAFAAAARE